MSPTQADPLTDPVIDLPRLARLFWRDKWLIALGTLVSAGCGIAYGYLSKPIYKAEALVQVRTEVRAPSALNSLAAQFGDLAEGGLLELGGNQDRSVTLATLKSRTLIDKFIEDLNLLPRLYPSKWDLEAHKWKSPDPEKQPTLWAGYNDFTAQILDVREDRKSGLVTVSVAWSDPAEAQRWVTELIARTNAYLRAEAIRESEHNLQYLDQQVAQVSQVTLRQSLFSLIEAEQKKLMLANGSEEFALKTIDPAAVPKSPVRPRKFLIAMTSLVLGMLASMLWVFGRAALKT